MDALPLNVILEVNFRNKSAFGVNRFDRYGSKKISLCCGYVILLPRCFLTGNLVTYRIYHAIFSLLMIIK